MKKGLILLAFAIGFATLSVTAKEQSPPMDEVQVSVPTIKNQLAAEQMPFVITNDVQSIDCVVLENELNFVSPIKSQPIFQLVCLSESPTMDLSLALTSWQSNGNLIQYVQSKRILNLGTHYIEGIATEYQIS